MVQKSSVRDHGGQWHHPLGREKHGSSGSVVYERLTLPAGKSKLIETDTEIKHCLYLAKGDKSIMRRRRRSQGDVWLLAVGCLAILLVIMLGVRRFILRPRYASLQEMAQAMEHANSRLKFTQIVPGVSWIDGERPRASYIITSKAGFSGIYLFDAYAYTIETGGTDQAAREFCSLFETLKTFRSDSPLLEAVRSIKLEGSFTSKVFDFNVEGSGSVLVETLYAVRSLLDLSSPHMDVLIKGFADGKRRDWSRPLVPHYEYREIDVLPPLNQYSINPVVYRNVPRQIQIPDPYKNSNLPDLRAEFVRRDLVEPVWRQCPGSASVSVKVLDGYEFARPNSPNLRKVEIQVNVF